MGFSEGVLPQPKAQHSQNTGFAEGRPPPPPPPDHTMGGGGGPDTPDAGPYIHVYIYMPSHPTILAKYRCSAGTFASASTATAFPCAKLNLVSIYVKQKQAKVSRS